MDKHTQLAKEVAQVLEANGYFTVTEDNNIIATDYGKCFYLPVFDISDGDLLFKTDIEKASEKWNKFNYGGSPNLTVKLSDGNLWVIGTMITNALLDYYGELNVMTAKVGISNTYPFKVPLEEIIKLEKKYEVKE